MKAVELAKATGALADYVRRARREPLVVVDQGKTVAALVPLDGEDWEDFVVTHHTGLMAQARESLERYRAEGGAPLEAVMAECSVAPKPPKAIRRRPSRLVVRRRKQGHIS